MGDVIEKLTQIWMQPIALWILGSFLGYGFAANAAWLLRSQGFQRRPWWLCAVQVGRFLYYLGIPYLALGGWPRPQFGSLLSPEDLGLVGFGPRWPAARWLAAVGDGFGAALVVFLVLLLAWRSAGRLPFPRKPWAALLIEGLYLQVHWAFYRGAAAVVLGDAYAAVFLALGLIYLEWSLDPSWRQGWHNPSQVGERWLRTALALMAALIFLLTRNLWVCLAVHWALELAFRRLETRKPQAVAPDHARS